jgi:predicted TPR repeat methyltransferase
MSATTIKLEADLVKKVAALKPRDESISGYVRGLIENEHRAREHREAAVAYRQFLRENPDERAAMEVWESAPLVDEVEPRKP